MSASITAVTDRCCLHGQANAKFASVCISKELLLPATARPFKWLCPSVIMARPACPILPPSSAPHVRF
jgi:hypothetical protein